MGEKLNLDCFSYIVKYLIDVTHFPIQLLFLSKRMHSKAKSVQKCWLGTRVLLRISAQPKPGNDAHLKSMSHFVPIKVVPEHPSTCPFTLSESWFEELQEFFANEDEWVFK